MKVEFPAIQHAFPNGQGMIIQTALIFEPRDLWIGAYWKRQAGALRLEPPHSRVVTAESLVIYLCLLPCLPIRLIVSLITLH